MPLVCLAAPHHLAASLLARRAPRAPRCRMVACAGVSDIEEACVVRPEAAQPWDAAHAAACSAGAATYADPATGYTVFTAAGLRAQRVCCGSGCRHCPYGEQHVAAERRRATALPPAPVLLAAARRPARPRGAPPPPEPPPGPPRRAVLWTGGAEQLATADGAPPPLAALLFDATTGAVLFAMPPVGGASLVCAVDAVYAARVRPACPSALTTLSAVACPAQYRHCICTPRTTRCLLRARTLWRCRCRRRWRERGARSPACCCSRSAQRSQRSAWRVPTWRQLWPRCQLPLRPDIAVGGAIYQRSTSRRCLALLGRRTTLATHAACLSCVCRASCAYEVARP